MDVVTALRLNMTNIDDPAAAHGPRYRAALEMAEYADRHGFAAISCEEHHGSGTGWLPSPLLLAAALAARTSRVAISISALLVPLYDPVRLAEDIAVLDNLTGGRLAIVAGMGYRPEEYAALGRDFARRGRLMDEALEIMLAAWRGEEVEYRGAPVRVTPRPLSAPHPLLLVGGMTEAAARRAARFGLPFSPPMSMPELEDYYLRETERQGTFGFVHRPEPGSRITLLHSDPERGWQEYGPHILTEAREYGSWRRAGLPRPHEYDVSTPEEIRELGYAEILTPDQLLAQIASGRTEIIVNPLIGGLPIESGWETLHLLADEVLPQLVTPEAARDQPIAAR
ncbi:LLM class flavin-dependent oxidoreductase [Nocardia stercoris]|uniref:LLM class flavin-dependent oxidoreductase n=1 Tax=Nocardia stercoris TaxID=2483361 RepID=A0A3M2KTV4_9NOCA|nr:LLM class flavin-dependent oxidoreductase [Nocardia stercoris]RMI28384.1 LLM class flavin-dependent oxidoreductase [Nocardia stercoris]